MEGYIYELTQLKSPHFPWQIVFYLFVGGIAAGAYMVTALVQAFGGKLAKAGLHRAYYVTFALVPLCGILLIAKLEQKSRFVNVLWQGRDGVPMLNPNSPMSVGSWVLSVFSIFAVLGVLYAFQKDGLLQYAWAKKLYALANALHEGAISKVFLVVGSFFAGWFSIYLGVLLTTTNLPAWNATPLIPTLWMCSAVVTGASTVMLVLFFSQKNGEFSEYIQGLNRIVSSMIVVHLAVLVLFVIALGKWSVTVNGGTFGILLWGGTVFLGLLIPLLLKLKPTMLGTKGTLLTSSILLLIGGFILRYVVVMGPQSYW